MRPDPDGETEALPLQSLAGPIQRSDLRGQVISVLKANIVSGEFRVGRVYSTIAVAKAMGVSVTPVREAVLDLAHSGLVEIIRNRGFRPLSISDDDLDEIRDLRLLLEAPAMKMVVEHASDAELAALKPIVGRMQIASDRDLTEFLQKDHEFHIHLLKLARNDRLVRMVETLRDQTRLFGIAALLREGALKETMQEHYALVDALLSRDSQRAVALMEKHVGHTRGIWAGRSEMP